MFLNRFLKPEFRSNLHKLAPTKQGVIGVLSLLCGKRFSTPDYQVDFSAHDSTPYPFSPHYQQHIFPHVETFEAFRLETLRQLQKRLWMGSFVFVASLALMVLVVMNLPDSIAKSSMIKTAADLVFYAYFIAIMCLLGWVASPVPTYKSNIKSDIFPKVFDYFTPNEMGQFHYQEESPIPISSFESSQLLPGYDSSSTLEDYIKGEYKGVSIEMVEGRLKETRRTNNGSRTVITFRGMFIQLSMNKNFNGHTLIKRDQGKMFNWISNKFSDSKDKQKVALEDPLFEKEFEVFSDDQVEARYLLTTSFMERLMTLSKSFDNKGIQAAFYNYHLLLMISCKQDRFEAGSIFQPATFESEINTVLSEMQQIFGIIDTLKLNEHTRL